MTYYAALVKVIFLSLVVYRYTDTNFYSSIPLYLFFFYFPVFVWNGFSEIQIYHKQVIISLCLPVWFHYFIFKLKHILFYYKLLFPFCIIKKTYSVLCVCTLYYFKFLENKNRGTTKIFIIKSRHWSDVKNCCFKHINMYLFYSLYIVNSISEIFGSDSTECSFGALFSYIFYDCFNCLYFLDFYLLEFFDSWLIDTFFPGIFCVCLLCHVPGGTCTKWEPFYNKFSAHAISPLELQHHTRSWL